MEEWITKHDLTMFCLQETYFRTKDTNKSKVKRLKNSMQIVTNKELGGYINIRKK